MSIYRSGTFTVSDTSAVQTLNLGFVPDYLVLEDITLLKTSGSGITAVWDSGMNVISGGPITKLLDSAAGTITQSTLTTTGILSTQTADAALFVPAQSPYNVSTGTRAYIGQSTLQVIDNGASAITQAANALVTASQAHSFTSADIGVTVVTFHGVPGMTQINGLSGVIQSVPSGTTFTVNIDSTNFTAYLNGETEGTASGFFNVITGAPANTVYGNVSLPTAEANLGIIGVTIGTGVVGAVGASNDDIWTYHAWLQSPVTGP